MFAPSLCTMISNGRPSWNELIHDTSHSGPSKQVRTNILPENSDAADVSGSDDEHEFIYHIPRPVKLVVWTDFNGHSPDWHDKHAPNCLLDEPYQWMGVQGVTPDPDYDISEANVVLINLSELERHYSLPAKKWPGQLWIASCWEPPTFGDGSEGAKDLRGDCSLLDDEETMSWFDGVASYDGSSEFPSLFTPPTEAMLRRPAPDFAARGPEVATFAFGDCRWAERNSFVEGLNSSLASQGYPGMLLAYGHCMHNADEPQCAGPEAVQIPSRSDAIYDMQLAYFANRCSSRPFQLVAENTNAAWYVTEKIWNALAIGSIPVYLGSEDAKKLVPPSSAIFASDYESPEALVHAMLALSQEDYVSAREWKAQPVSEWGGWSFARQHSRVTLPARLCEFAARSEFPIDGLARQNAEPWVNPVLKRAGKGRPTALRRKAEAHDIHVASAGGREALEAAGGPQAFAKTHAKPLNARR